MRIFLLLSFVILTSFSFGQQSLTLENDAWKAGKTTQTDFKSYSYAELDTLGDSIPNQLSLSFVPDLLAAYQNKQFAIRSGAQMHVDASWKKLHFISDFRFGYSNVERSAYTSILQAKSFFRSEINSGKQEVYNDIRGRISYSPNKYFRFQTGIDHHFLGEGDRSLLSGNQGVPNPFASIRVKFWQFEYQLIQNIWKERIDRRNSPKGNVMHYIGFKANKRFSIGLFETVVYNMKDTLYNRGLEVEYLNPILFYRPQEYSLGSSDNVMLGLNSSYKWKKNTLYCQFILDDFLLGEIRARNRWWANKYGVQLGYKASKTKGNKTIFTRSEFNLVRPFTYSQVRPGDVYGNVGMPVAHPSGSNFVEFYQEVSVYVDKWQAQLWIQAQLKGNDTLFSSLSYGGDIYKPYNNRPLNEEYGYTIGRGDTYRFLQVGLHLARKVIHPDWLVFVEPRIFIQNREGTIGSDFRFTFGIQRSIGADRRNY